jgi:hypothetical protein
LLLDLCTLANTYCRLIDEVLKLVERTFFMQSTQVAVSKAKKEE